MAPIKWWSWNDGLPAGASGGEVYAAIKHTGAYAYRVPAATPVDLLLPGTHTELFAAAWAYIGSFATQRTLLAFYSGGFISGGVAFNTDGRLFLFGEDGSMIGSPYDLVLSPAAWYLVQLHNLVGSSGVLEVKLGGTLILEGDPVDTRPDGVGATVDRLVSVGSSADTILDDVVVDDADWPGDARIVTLHPNGAGNATAYTRSDVGIAHYEHVNDVPPDTGVDDEYVYAPTGAASGTREQFTLEDMSGISGNYTIVAVQANVVASESAATGLTQETGVRVGSTDYDDGLNHVLQTTQTRHEGLIRETNPATSVAWTDSDVNALQAGVKVP
jgi:hypothetical protein